MTARRRPVNAHPDGKCPQKPADVRAGGELPGHGTKSDAVREQAIVALLKAGVRGGLPRFLFATALFFAADLVGSVAAVVQHVVDRPYRWHNLRQADVTGDADR